MGRVSGSGRCLAFDFCLGFDYHARASDSTLAYPSARSGSAMGLTIPLPRLLSVCRILSSVEAYGRAVSAGVMWLLGGLAGNGAQN